MEREHMSLMSTKASIVVTRGVSGDDFIESDEMIQPAFRSRSQVPKEWKRRHLTAEQVMNASP
jgi:hypothetical protein